LSDEQLKHEQLQIQWVSRGGGCVLHAPGQLAVYPIVPLGVLGWTVGHYLRQLQRGVLDALDGLGIRGETRKRSFGVWGRSGQLACMGAAIRNWVSLHGVFLNVNPPMRHFAFVDSCPEAEAEGPVKTTMGCLLAERQASVKMTGVRAALVESLAAAFGSERYHLFTGHPWLKPGTACASNIGEL
jgi:lipoyl(octanoyl) transferase